MEIDIDDELKRWTNSYQMTKQRIPLETDRLKKEISETEQGLQNAIKDGKKFYIDEWMKILKQAKYELMSYEERVSFLREPTKDDILYRERQRQEFSKKAGKILSSDLMLCFHGTSISGAKHIIQSGEISSSVDRLGRQTSFDPRGLFSVTNKDTVDTSVGIYMHLNDSYCYPAGCLFVVLPENKEEYQKLSSTGWMIKNVNFKENPDRLNAIITTPENIQKVTQWAQEAGVDTKKIVDFDGFIDKHSKQNEQSNILRLPIERMLEAGSQRKG